MPCKEGNKWRASRMIDGKRRSKMCRTRAEAVKWEAAQDAERWDEEERQISTLSWANAYLSFARDRFTKMTYQEKCRAFRTLFSVVDSDAATAEIKVRDVYAALANRAKVSGNEANKDRKNLRAAWSWGVKHLGLTKEGPFDQLDRFAYDASPRYVPPEKDFWAAYAEADEESQAFLLTALHTAARRGELFRLQWQDVDFKRGMIRLGTRKTVTGSLEYAWVPLTSDLLAKLARHKQTALRGLHVFTTPEGQPFTSRQHYMKAICRRAGVKRFGFHAIRHLSASTLAAAGVPLPAIQTILRHRAATTTSRYLRDLGHVENHLEGVFCQAKEKGQSAATD